MFCNEMAQICAVCLLIASVLLMCALLVKIYFLERSRRAIFLDIKMRNKQKDLYTGLLLKQKNDQAQLLQKIFPKGVASKLIKQSSAEINDQDCLRVNTAVGRTLAEYHTGVTILFSDIVGFTSMAQACFPHEVMAFLHELFIAFDDLVDIEDQLWKVETIGDAFMVASGLGSYQSESSVDTSRSTSAFRIESGMDRSRSMKTSAAYAAVKFGKRILEESREYEMPNGEACQIRVGVHTGDVASGVVGSRMESTSLPGRMQISEETHVLLSDVERDCVWEERGRIDVKGKGKMKTYFLQM